VVINKGKEFAEEDVHILSSLRGRGASRENATFFEELLGLCPGGKPQQGQIEILNHFPD
jgi:hypothetical protein